MGWQCLRWVCCWRMSFGSECKDNVLFDVGLGGWRLKPLRAEGVRCTGLNYTDKAKGAKLGYTETHGEPAHEGLTAHVRVQRRRRTCGRCAPVTRNPWTLAAQMPARRGPAGSWRALDRPGSLRLARASLIWTNPPRPATPNPPLEGVSTREKLRAAAAVAVCTARVAAAAASRFQPARNRARCDRDRTGNLRRSG